MTEREQFRMSAIHTLSTIALDNPDNVRLGRKVFRTIQSIIIDDIVFVSRDIKICVEYATNDDDKIALCTIHDGLQWN